MIVLLMTPWLWPSLAVAYTYHELTRGILHGVRR